MIDQKRVRDARENFAAYLREGLLKKERNETAKAMYLKNSEISIKAAQTLTSQEFRPYLWVIVCSYYSMFYAANAVLLDLGYKTGDKIVHKVTSDALVVLVLDRLKREIMEGYEEVKEDALEIASAEAESLLEDYERELSKRSRFQYKMPDEAKEQKAATSLERARRFTFEMKKLLA